MATLRTLVDGTTAYAEDCNFNFSALNNESSTISSSVSSLSSTVTGHTSSISTINGNISTINGSISTLNTKVAQAMPVGTTIWYRGTSAPTGFLVCDGSYLPATYSALRAICGDYLPNLINRIVKGNQSVMQWDTTLWDSVVNLNHAHAVGNQGYPTTSGYALGDHNHSVTLPTVTLLPCIKY